MASAEPFGLAGSWRWVLGDLDAELQVGEEPIQLAVKLGQHSEPDNYSDCLDDLNHRLATYGASLGSLVESYVRGNLGVHLHFRWLWDITEDPLDALNGVGLSCSLSASATSSGGREYELAISFDRMDFAALTELLKVMERYPDAHLFLQSGCISIS
jgi:hypothetical protein